MKKIDMLKLALIASSAVFSINCGTHLHGAQDKVGCKSQQDCKVDEQCDTVQKKCVKKTSEISHKCTDSNGCDKGKECNQSTGKCEALPAGKCNKDGDCENGKTCNLVAHTCENHSSSVCHNKGDCGAHKRCNTGTGKCENIPVGQCDEQEDCASTEKCKSNKCIAETTAQCDTNKDCVTKGLGNLCIFGKHSCETVECTEDQDCIDKANGTDKCTKNHICKKTDDQCKTNKDCLDKGLGDSCNQSTKKCSCSDTTIKTNRKKPNIMLVLDVSSSMGNSVARNPANGSRMEALQKALTELIKKTYSNVNYGMILFGLNEIPSSVSCFYGSSFHGNGVNTVANIGVDTEKQLLDIVNKLKPECGTPTGAALTEASKDPKIKNSAGNPTAVIVVTDGISRDEEIESSKATAKELYSKGTKVYVIGVDNITEPQISHTSPAYRTYLKEKNYLDSLAQNGGTSAAFPANNTNRLAGILKAITIATTGCTFKLTTPSAGADLSRVYVALDGNQLPYYAYEINQTAGEITLKPEACATYNQVGKLDISVACKSTCEPDKDAQGNPVTEEHNCDGVDNNCDGRVDEGCNPAPKPCAYLGGTCGGGVTCCDTVQQACISNMCVGG